MALSGRIEFPYRGAGGHLQRLFSTFANGLPGVGLLLQRLITGGVLVEYTITHLTGSAQPAILLPQLAALGAGALLIIGLWTPVMGGIVAFVELWTMVAGSGDPWIPVLLATLGISLAFIGPGAWSVDARIFGRKQISVSRPQEPFHSD
jgi:putative oxidoreductase